MPSPRWQREWSGDAAGRITTVSGDGGVAETYAYDSAGNITQAAWAAPDTEAQGDRRYQGTLLVEAGRDRYDYDGAGRLVRRTRRLLSGGEKVWQFAWNPLNQLTSVIDPIGHRWDYAYDGLGRRVGKAHRDGAGQVVEVWRFAWDGPVLVEQTHQVGGVETSTTWEHDGFTPVAQARSRSQADFDVEFAAIITDLVGAPVRVQNAAGQVEWTSAASTWGATDADVAMPLRFPGQYHDVETGLFYNLNRYYNPDTGRYVSSDPLGLAPSPNPHAYVPNPTTQIDPLGLAKQGVNGNGLRSASDGLASVFGGGSVRGRSIVDIRAGLLNNGFMQGLTRNKAGYLFTNGTGEEVRIMWRGGGWDIRVRNAAGNYLEELGNVAAPGSTHSITVFSR